MRIDAGGDVSIFVSEDCSNCCRICTAAVEQAGGGMAAVMRGVVSSDLLHPFFKLQAELSISVRK